MGGIVRQQAKSGRKSLHLSSKRRSRRRAQKKHQKNVLRDTTNVQNESFMECDIDNNKLPPSTRQETLLDICNEATTSSAFQENSFEMNSEDIFESSPLINEERNLTMENQRPSEIILEGRRIVDIGFFFQQVQEICNNEYEIKHLETETRGQASNALWKQERAVRLTASHFGAICKMRANTSRHNKLKNILYSNFVGNNSTRYGCEKEPFAIRQFETEFDVTVQSCGLFVDEDNCVLAASPDGLVGNDAIIEVKCPAIAATIDPKEAITKKKITFAVLSEENDLILKRNHNYFFQIQGQLHITKRKFCYFVVWSPHGMLVEKIERDVSFWNTKMLIPLKKFYFENMLPELVDARFPRGMEMRNCNKTKDK